MKTPLLMLGVLSAMVLSCQQGDHPTQPKSGNTVNAALTPDQQSESEADRTITQNIRQAVVASDKLSSQAKNVKIITVQGKVHLTGTVPTVAEKSEVDRLSRTVAGVTGVDNQLQVSK